MNFMNQNKGLARILALYFVLPFLAVNASDLVYGDDSSWIYWAMTLVLIGIVLVCTIIGLVRINRLFGLREGGVVKRYFMSWASAVFPFSLLIVWFYGLIFVGLLGALFRNELLLRIGDGDLTDIALDIYLILVLLMLPLLNLASVRYIYGREYLLDSLYGALRMKAGAYFVMVGLLLLDVVLMAVMYEFSTAVTVSALVLSGVVHWFYLLKLSEAGFAQLKQNG